ncbi:LOW QUALITY PROTEIN: hypothetical protein NC652_037213 [Populus alba x Populus x berolinensis]|nr:LOW QUALITY PROTEIN: hypothetical protein NC652_037213 [Populus alba x Populus x berolinensis]
MLDARILANIEIEMQAFEESAELKRVEIERNDNKILKVKWRRTGMRGCSSRTWARKHQLIKQKPRKEAQKIKDLIKAKAGFNGRLGIAIANSSISSSPDWRKVVFLGAILAGLINQIEL